MVGVLEHDQPTIGWVYAPVFDRLYFGGRQLGLFQATGTTQTPLVPVEPAPPSTDFCPLIIGDKDRKRYGAAIAQQIPGVTYNSIGSFGLKVMEVIGGRAGLYLYLNRRVKLWDTTAPLALAQAAGLVCCDLEGNPLHFTADAVDLQTLAHQQMIIVGWASYVEALRSTLRRVVNSL
jgi:3'(2'), 5'-bisphosphate nucleotidase